MAPSATRRPSWRIVTPILAIAAFGLVGCSAGQESSDAQGTTPPVWTGSAAPADASGTAEQGESSSDSVEVQMKDASGQPIGKATIADAGDHVKITVEAHGLTPGFHGLHVHEFGKCEPNSTAPSGGEPGDFKSAGGHLQVGDPNAHPASGDLTSLEVRKDGTARLVTTTDALTFEQLKDKALMIHAGADNFGNIPDRYETGGKPGPDAKTLSTGDAGGRIACGVIG